MRRSRAAAALGATAVLLAGVLLVRGGTAVDAADLVPAGGEAEPSATASTDDAADEAVLLTANGLPGLRLGAAPGGGLELRSAVLELPAGSGQDRAWCDVAYPEYGTSPDGTQDQGAGLETPAMQRLVQRMSVGAWLVDGEVVSVRVQTWEDPSERVDVLRSWAGVTIGSPVAVASELPGARTSLERPWPDEPAVTVVRVPLQGGGTELVVSDVSMDGVPGEGGSGRVSTLEVRTAAGAACTRAMADEVESWHGARDRSAEPVQVGADGSVGALRVAAPVAPLEAAGDLVPDDDREGLGGACGWWVGEDPRVRAMSRDGVVARVEVEAPFEVAGAFQDGVTAAGLLSGPLGARVSTDRYVAPSGSVPVTAEQLEASGAYVHLDGGAMLSVGFHQPLRAVPEVGVPVAGGTPVAEWLTVLPPVRSDLDPWAC